MKILYYALALGLVTSIVAPAAHAQSRDTTSSSLGPRAALTAVAAGAVATGAAYVTAPRLGRTPESDGWKGYDKLLHGTSAFALTTVLVDVGASPVEALVMVCALGLVIEASQTRASRYDAASNCMGATAAAMWRSWLR